MAQNELIPDRPLNTLPEFTQHVFRVCRGTEGSKLAGKTPEVLAAFDELVAARYARIVPGRIGAARQQIQMANLHGAFALAYGFDGTQDIYVEIMSPDRPDDGEAVLLAVITNCEFSIMRHDPWPIAGIFAFHDQLTDVDDDPIRTASLSVANPMLVRSYGAHRQVWIGTLTSAHLYPAGSDIAVASLDGPASNECHSYMPPSITAVVPSVVRVTVRPSKSFLSASA